MLLTGISNGEINLILAGSIILILFVIVIAEIRKANQMREEKRRELMAKMSGGVAMYLADPKKGSFKIISQNEYLKKNYSVAGDFDLAVAKYIAKDVFELDRVKVEKEINIPAMVRNLETKDEYIVRYRDISAGYPRWYEMRAIKLNDNKILYGFADKDQEICEQFIFEKMRDNYVGLYYVNLETKLAQIITSKREEIGGKVGDVLPYEELIKKFLAQTRGEEAEVFKRISDINSLRYLFSQSDSAYSVYKTYLLDKDDWMGFNGLVLARNDDGHASVVAMGFSKLDEEASKDEEIKQQLAQSLEVVKGLADEYTALFHVNLDTGEFVPFHTIGRVEIVRELFAKCTSMDELALLYTGGDLVRFEDREKIKEFFGSCEKLKEKLRDKKRISMLYKHNYNGEFLWTELSIVKCEEKDEEVHNVIVGFIEKNRQVIEEMEQIHKAHEADRLINGIAARYNLAYIVNLNDDSFRTLRVDKGIVGGNETFDCFSKAISYFLDGPCHPTDRARMSHELDYSVIRKRLEKAESYDIEYRALIDNETIWHKMNVTKIDLDEVTIGFAIKDMDIINHRLWMKRDDELFALFEVDLDTLMVKIVKNDRYYKDIFKGRIVPYSDFMANFANVFSDEAKAFFMQYCNLDYVKKDLAVDDKRSFTYKSTVIPGDNWIEVTIFVISRHEDGSPAVATIGFSVIDALAMMRQEFQDQLKEAYDSVTEARMLAEKASESKSNFLFNITHDIRTPMNAIIGFTNMAKKNMGDNEKLTDYLDKINTSGQQLMALINQVLEMARIESGKAELEENRVNVRKEFDAAVAVLSEQAKVRGVCFNPSLKNVVHEKIWADSARMNSITLNITGNAMKYTPRGGDIDFILEEVKGRKEGYATFVFTVIDTGIGMSDEYMKVLFEPFTREKSSTVSKIQGTGLGMSIVKDMVELAGGDITVSSQIGKGTRFDVIIDFRIDDSTLEEEVKQKDSVDLEGKRILLVEDNTLNREIAVDILKDEGAIIEEAEDGTIAVSLLKEKGSDYYNIILMDIQMPIMNGYEATRAIREMYPSSPIPIIALSANAFLEDRERSMEAGMDDHVAKPINVANLMEVLARFV